MLRSSTIDTQLKYKKPSKMHKKKRKCTVAIYSLEFYHYTTFIFERLIRQAQTRRDEFENEETIQK